MKKLIKLIFFFIIFLGYSPFLFAGSFHNNSALKVLIWSEGTEPKEVYPNGIQYRMSCKIRLLLTLF